MDNKQYAEDVTVEEIIAQYFDTDALIEPPYRLYRLDNKGERWYYRIADDGKPVFYLSVTSLCNATLPTSPHLIKWIAEMGQREAKRYAEIKAHYGTLMHELCGRLLIDEVMDLESIDVDVSACKNKHGLTSEDVKGWEDELRKDLLAWAQFIQDRNVSPLAIEVAAIHESGYAGAIDLVCMIDHKGKDEKEPRRVRAIIDMKSGKKGFYEAHEIQLHAYKSAWNATFGNMPVERVYNWSPKAWRTSPSYNLKDQTDSSSAKKLQSLVDISAIERGKREKTVLKVGGILYLSKGADKNYSVITLDELVNENRQTELSL